MPEEKAAEARGFFVMAHSAIHAQQQRGVSPSRNWTQSSSAYGARMESPMRSASTAQKPAGSHPTGIIASASAGRRDVVSSPVVNPREPTLAGTGHLRELLGTSGPQSVAAYGR